MGIISDHLDRKCPQFFCHYPSDQSQGNQTNRAAVGSGRGPIDPFIEAPARACFVGAPPDSLEAKNDLRERKFRNRNCVCLRGACRPHPSVPGSIGHEWPDRSSRIKNDSEAAKLTQKILIDYRHSPAGENNLYRSRLCAQVTVGGGILAWRNPTKKLVQLRSLSGAGSELACKVIEQK